MNGIHSKETDPLRGFQSSTTFRYVLAHSPTRVWVDECCEVAVLWLLGSNYARVVWACGHLRMRALVCACVGARTRTVKVGRFM